MTKKIKLYGLLDFTKQQYLIMQSIVFAIFFVIVLLSFVFDLRFLMWGYLREIAIITILLEIGETYLVLRKYR